LEKNKLVFGLHLLLNYSHLFLAALKLEKRDVQASQTLRAALIKAEQTNPGLTHELVKGIIRKLSTLKIKIITKYLFLSYHGNINLFFADKGSLNVNMYESILRLQGAQQALSDSSDRKYIRPQLCSTTFILSLSFFNFFKT
jgi:hypothetical protein